MVRGDARGAVSVRRMLSATKWLTVAHRASLEFRRSTLSAPAPPRLVDTPSLSRRLGTAAGMADPDGVADARFDASGVEIEIPLPLPIGTKRLQRPADEPAGKALARLCATVDKARKKTATKKKSDGDSASAASLPPPTATLRETTSGAALDPETLNVDAWASGRTLVVDGVGSFRIRVNAPSLESVAVCGYPVVGLPLVAKPLGTRHCDEDEDLAYEWFRLARKSADGEVTEASAFTSNSSNTTKVRVGTGRVYAPVPADRDHVLAVMVTPKPPPGDNTPCGAPASFVTPRATAAMRSRPHAWKRMAQFVPSNLSSEGEGLSSQKASSTRIMTYNALADAYSHTWGSLYPYFPAAAADPHARLPLAMQDVLLASPEIVALQEVDRKWYGEFWEPQMRAAGYAPAGPLAEKTGLTREGCCIFVRADTWRVVDAAVVSLKRPGPMPEEEATAAFVAKQPQLREALEKISTVGLVATLEPRRDDGARRPLVVANAHLFFHPGAMHVRALQTRWLLRHAQKARETYASKSSSSRSEREDAQTQTREARSAKNKTGLVVCGDMNAEPFDAAARFATEGELSAADADWALGSMFRWGGTSSRAAAAELASMDRAPRGESSASIEADLQATHQKLERMAACWRACAEIERGDRAPCAARLNPTSSPGRGPEARGGDGVDGATDPFLIARHHARNGCTFKTCDRVAAWTFRRDAGMAPGVSLAGTAKARWPGAEARASPEPDSGVGGGGEPARCAGMGPERAREDACDSAPGPDGIPRDARRASAGGDLASADRPSVGRKESAAAAASDVAAASAAARKALEAHRAGLRAVQISALALEREAMDALERANAEAGGWVAAEVGASAMHLRHPLRLRSACGDPEWTNFVGGFRGALDYVWCDTSRDTSFGAAVVPVAHAPMPPLEAVTAQTALPNDEFPSDHLPMVADVRFVS